jgi:hypothetical protein
MSTNQRRKIAWGPVVSPSTAAATQVETNRPLPQPVLDTLPMAQARKRTRNWERRNRGVTYRGVQRELLIQLQEVAGGLNVLTDDVARAFLEYGLSAYRDGKLILNPRPRGIRMTLYPRTGQQAALRATTRRSKPKKGKTSPAWESRATFRGFPNELQEGVRQAADDLCVPVGEVAVAFFRYALEAYQDGLLMLNPHPKIAAMTLSGD